ncbi:MAG: tRNA (N(6)-L-threonylcarbamoyladenosine(37)-C(2))-methylthiotransferase MtaB [Rickettsia sp.]|nr:tRNA (N(6)-L-threonylcarbamoyladenosine(37)-C(2))-methylthiotransferase MtaB [Rickettsia sp.]
MSNTKDNFQIITFGCRLNIFETGVIKEKLENSNLKDTVIINSCTVTNEAKNSVKKAIRKLKKKDPHKKIIVTGCAAQKDPLEFAEMKEVSKVIGNEEKFDSKYYLDANNNINQNFSNGNLDFKSKIAVRNIMDIKTISSEVILKNIQPQTRAFMQIQNGCNHRCTFCVIPFGRGNSRSVKIENILEQIRNFISIGYKEIIFTGIDISCYGEDLQVKITLSEMIRRVLINFPELKRLRLSSIDLAEIDDDLFNLIATQKRIMPHIHISLQAGSDMILKRMKRRHRRSDIIDFCHNLRSIRHDVAFGADIIAGFPTETEEMFEETKNLISEAQIQYLHVFPYSAHSGTPASRMPQINRETIKKRVAILIEEGKNQENIFFKNHMGKKAQILVEQGKFSHTENFIPVKLEEEISKKYYGQILNAKLTESGNKNYLKAII